MKSNKSIQSRVRITRNGKILARGKGRSHCNAKHERSKKLNQKRQKPVTIPKKIRQRYALTA